MQKEFGLHELAVEDARHGHQRPKIEEYGDSLFVVLQVIEPSNGDLNVGEMAIFVGKNYVLSVRSRAKRGSRGRLKNQPKRRSAKCCYQVSWKSSSPSLNHLFWRTRVRGCRPVPSR